MEKLNGEVTKTKITLSQDIFNKLVEDLDMGMSKSNRYIGTGKCYTGGDDEIVSAINNGLNVNVPASLLEMTTMPARTKFIEEVIKAPISNRIGSDEETAQQMGLICLNNMVLDTKLRIESKIRPKLTTYIDVDYDVTVDGDEVSRFMKTIFGKFEPEFKKFLGSCLIRDKTVAYKKFFVVVKGQSNTGKSLFSNFINNFFGNTASQLSLPNMTAKFDTVRMLDKFVNVANEISFEDKASKEIIKQITGRDKIKMEDKNEKSFMKELIASFIFLGNEDLSLSAADHAVAKRGYNYDLDTINGGKNLKELYTKAQMDDLIPGTNPKIMNNGKSHTLTYILEGMEEYIEASKEDDDGIGLTKSYDMKTYIKEVGNKQSNLSEGGDDRLQGVTTCQDCGYFNDQIHETIIQGGALKVNYEHGLTHQRTKKNHYNNNIVHFMTTNGGTKEELNGGKSQGVNMKI